MLLKTLLEQDKTLATAFSRFPSVVSILPKKKNYLCITYFVIYEYCQLGHFFKILFIFLAKIQPLTKRSRDFMTPDNVIFLIFKYILVKGVNDCTKTFLLFFAGVFETL